MIQEKLHRKMDSEPEKKAEQMEIDNQYEINLYSEDYDGVEFCLFADDSEKPLLLIEDGWAYAQSAGRVHTYKLELSFENGLYEAIQIKPNKIIICGHKDIEDEFPNLKALKDVFEVPFKATPVISLLEDIDVCSMHADITRNIPDDASMNYQFIKDLKREDDERHHFEYLLYTKENGAMLFVGKTRKAALMPRLPKNKIKGGMRVKDS